MWSNIWALAGRALSRPIRFPPFLYTPLRRGFFANQSLQKYSSRDGSLHTQWGNPYSPFNRKGQIAAAVGN